MRRPNGDLLDVETVEAEAAAEAVEVELETGLQMVEAELVETVGAETMLHFSDLGQMKNPGDSGTGHIVMENPFTNQISSVHHDGYSINIFSLNKRTDHLFRVLFHLYLHLFESPATSVSACYSTSRSSEQSGSLLLWWWRPL